MLFRSFVVTEDLPLEYRLHYNEFGDIYMCTMQDHPVDTQYVVVTKEQYDLYFRFKIVKGQLVSIQQDNGVRAPLIKSRTGFKVVANHAALLLTENETFENVEYYDRRNS